MFAAMRILWAVIAVAVALSGALAYRVVRLERRVAALGKLLGAPGANVGGRAAPDETQGDHEQRLRTLEQDARTLRDELRTLEQATGEQPAGAPDAPVSDQRILSVVNRQQALIRDRQLEFHRARWLEWRASALDNFAKTNKLSPTQAAQLERLLTEEVDALVKLLQRPEVAEEPEQAANDWLDRLELTDRAAHAVLDDTQATAWEAARTAERRTFWPWLPQD